MALPDNAVSQTPQPAPLLAPDTWKRESWAEDYERGGIAFQDPQQGLDVRAWRAWTDGSSIWVAPHPEGAPATLVTTGAGITEVHLAWDQNMNVAVAFVEAGAVKLRWFDTVTNAMVTTIYPGARSPALCTDDKRALASLGGWNDVIFAYIRADGMVCYRQQRDRYSVEYELAQAASSDTRIRRIGMGTNFRLQIEVEVAPAYSARFSDLLTDSLYVVSGGEIRALHGAAPEAARWRSRTYTTNEQPTFPWARVEADAPLIFRLLGDGMEVLFEATVSGPAPFRLPAVVAGEWAVELQGATPAVQVAMAQSPEEFL